MPGAPTSASSARTPGVMVPRSSARSGSGPKRSYAAWKSALPGPKIQLPSAAVVPAGMPKYEEKPTKWSRRT